MVPKIAGPPAIELFATVLGIAMEANLPAVGQVESDAGRECLRLLGRLGQFADVGADLAWSGSLHRIQPPGFAAIHALQKGAAQVSPLEIGSFDQRLAQVGLEQ